jgi:hypothetical protein
MRLRDAFEDFYLPNSHRSAAYRRTQRHQISRWEKLSRNPDVTSIGTADFSHFRSQCIASGLSADTIEGTIATALQVLTLLHRIGLLSSVPWPGTRLKKRRVPKWVPTIEEIGRCYAHAHVAKWPTYMDAGQFWRTWYAVSLWSGLRRSDVLFRLNRDMCTEDGIRCQAQKTDRVHIFPMHAVVWRHLQAMPATERVFQVSNSLKQVRRELDRISDAAGVSPRIQPQAVRRASITAWEECAGAGRIIHGCAADVVSNHYLAVRQPPRQLINGASRFVWPEEMLTPEDRDQQQLQTNQFLKVWERLNPKDREAVRSIAERLVG